MTNKEERFRNIFLQYQMALEEECNRREIEAHQLLQEGRFWIPFRYCSQDWILGAFVTRVLLGSHRYEIAFLEYEDHPDYEEGSGLRGSLIFILSDAYLKLGKMAIYFRGRRPSDRPSMELGFEPVIPDSVRSLAERLGVSFNNQSHISNAEGRALYIRLSDISLEIQGLLEAWNVDPVEVAFLLNRTIWVKEQVELIIRYACNPPSVFQGTLIAENWLTNQADFLLLRLGIMGERVGTLLEIAAKKTNSLTSTQLLSPQIMEYTVSKTVELETLFLGQIQIPANTDIRVILIPRDASQYNYYATNDFNYSKSDRMTFIAVSRDFDSVSNTTKLAAQTLLFEFGIRTIRIDETIAELDTEIHNRLSQSGSTRRDLAERPE